MDVQKIHPSFTSLQAALEQQTIADSWIITHDTGAWQMPFYWRVIGPTSRPNWYTVEEIEPTPALNPTRYEQFLPPGTPVVINENPTFYLCVLAAALFSQSVDPSSTLITFIDGQQVEITGSDFRLEMGHQSVITCQVNGVSTSLPANQRVAVWLSE